MVSAFYHAPRAAPTFRSALSWEAAAEQAWWGTMDERRKTLHVSASLAVVALLAFGCASDSAVELSTEACNQLRVVEDNRARDVTDSRAIRSLVEVLPEKLRDEAALFYYPHGGSVEGLDTSGTSAEKAGRVLEASLEKCE